jgi:predicted TPR repeat methyltransferase
MKNMQAIFFTADWSINDALEAAAAAAVALGATRLVEARFDVLASDCDRPLPSFVPFERVMERDAANALLRQLAVRALDFPALFVDGERVALNLVPAAASKTDVALDQDADVALQLRRFVRKALADRDDIDAYFNAGVLFHQHDLALLAVAMFARVAEERPQDVTAHCMLKEVLFPLEPKEVILAYRAMARSNPGNVRAVHHLAVLTGEGESTLRAEASYVAEVFDGLAATFEEKLVEHLGYRVPWILRDVVGAHLLSTESVPTADGGAVAPRWRRGVDLGCGSGLCGRLFRSFFAAEGASLLAPAPASPGASAGNAGPPVAARSSPLGEDDGAFIGVDLSPKMAAIAMAGGGYSETRVQDVHAALEAERPSSLDCVLSADTFIYVGVLRPCFELAASRLRPGGVFAFSTEVLSFDGGATAAIRVGGGDGGDGDDGEDASGAAPDPGFALVASGRFAHTAEYVEALLLSVGLSLRVRRSIVIRHEQRAPIPGIAWLAEAR